MTLRKKTLVIIGVTGVTLIAILYLATRLIVMGSFAALEEQNMIHTSNGWSGRYLKRIDRIAKHCRRLCSLDDSYQF
jgi:sensor domain CHASE-containing protein